MLKLKQLIFIILIICNPLFSEQIEQKNLKVTKIIDGDTIWVKDSANNSYKIRFLGIDTPEVTTIPKEPYADEATEALKNLIGNKNVSIIYNNKHKYDKYQRVLADVYTTDGLWLNGELVKLGLANVYILNYQPIPKIAELIKLENSAITQQKKLWGLLEKQPISPKQTNNNIGKYKIIDGTIIAINQTKNSVWLQMEETKDKGFSLRIDKQYLEDFTNIHPLKNLTGKNIRVRGFVDKYSSKFGPYINIQSPYSIEIKP
jgi:micrococcal nuclease